MNNGLIRGLSSVLLIRGHSAAAPRAGTAGPVSLRRGAAPRRCAATRIIALLFLLAAMPAFAQDQQPAAEPPPPDQAVPAAPAQPDPTAQAPAPIDQAPDAQQPADAPQLPPDAQVDQPPAQQTDDAPQAPVPTAVPSIQPVPTTAPAPGQPNLAPDAAPQAASSIDLSTLPATTQTAFIELNFKDAQLDAILDYLSQSAGFIVVKTGGRVDGHITLISRQPVGPEDAVLLLNSALKTVGFTAVQQGRILKIMPIEQSPRAAVPVHVGKDPEQIAITDEVITQVVPLVSVDATRLKQDLAPLISADSNLSSNASSNALIMTGPSVAVHRIVQIVAALDNNLVDAAEYKVFRLQYANATNAARLVTDLFRQQGTTASPGGNNFAAAMQRFAAARGGRGGGRGGFTPPGAANAPGGEGQRTEIPVNASADDRTNTLVVTGPKATLAIVADVIEKLDTDPTITQGVFVYNVKNGQAANMATVLNALFGVTGTNLNFATQRTGATGLGAAGSAFGTTGGFGGTSGRGTGGFGGTSGRGGGGFGGTSGRGGGGGFGGTSFGGGTAARGGTNTRGGGAAGNFVASRGGLSASAQQIVGDLMGQVYVVPNIDTNSLLVSTAPANFDRVKTIIDQLDRAVPQVVIKVLIAEVSHDNSLDLGAEFSALDLRASGNGAKIGTNFGIAQQSNGLTLSSVETNMTAALRALATTGKVDVLSRPYILASDNQLASITVGQSVPFVTNSRTDINGGIINTIQYQQVGIILNVTPHINPEGLVIMDVAPQISSLTQTTVPISETLNAPVYSLRQAQTRVSILDGQTIVIGGLMEDRKNQTINKVPILGDIPLLGALFRRTQDQKTKTELLIFLTPHVARVPEELQGMSQDEQSGSKIIQNAVAPGQLQEQLQGMQRGAATQPAPPDSALTTQPSSSTPRRRPDRGHRDAAAP